MFGHKYIVIVGNDIRSTLAEEWDRIVWCLFYCTFILYNVSYVLWFNRSRFCFALPIVNIKQCQLIKVRSSACTSLKYIKFTRTLLPLFATLVFHSFHHNLSRYTQTFPKSPKIIIKVSLDNIEYLSKISFHQLSFKMCIYIHFFSPIIGWCQTSDTSKFYVTSHSEKKRKKLRISHSHLKLQKEKKKA